MNTAGVVEKVIGVVNITIVGVVMSSMQYNYGCCKYRSRVVGGCGQYIHGTYTVARQYIHTQYLAILRKRPGCFSVCQFPSLRYR